MRRTRRSLEFDFSDKALKTIVAALPSSAPRERVALLPDILRAWARGDLREHLSREGRAAVQQREEQLQVVAKRAKDFLHAVEMLDERASFELALRPEGGREGAELWEVDVKTVGHQSDQAIAWLRDLTKALDERQRKPPPDKMTTHYLVMLDLAAIFEMVCGERASRRNGSGNDSAPYGPFWNFTKAVWVAIYGTDYGLQNAVKILAEHKSRRSKILRDRINASEKILNRHLNMHKEKDYLVIQAIGSKLLQYSPFIANLQFLCPNLWRKVHLWRKLSGVTL